MHSQLNQHDLDELHRHVVTEVLKHVVGQERIAGAPARQAVDAWFDQFPQDARELLPHDDAVLIALEVTGLGDRLEIVAEQRRLIPQSSEIISRAVKDWFQSFKERAEAPEHNSKP